ncbi:sigma 54-interacting transcriptional regulator [Brevibacillus sp. SYSU BS000544]|uniref:sigma 54-interacting transcriptional regulator n=1 Tax=Brevibacillus sp. SYSU BS000544 TaxID=3416443 RepID=UPI003CE4CA02
MNVFKIRTIDRVGITHDVIECFAQHQLDILAMEVVPQTIYLKLAALTELQQPAITAEIKKVIGVIDVDVIANLPSEERESQIQTILTTVSEGIISTDRSLVIQTINQAAAAMLGVEKDQVISSSLSTIWGHSIEEVWSCLTDGTEKSHLPVKLLVPSLGETKFVCCYRPIIIPPQPRAQGVVIVIRDMKQIHQLIETVKRPGAFTFEELIYEGNPMKQCVETAKRVSKSQATILLSGESGTGKELFAKAIHYESERSSQAFVPINCAAIPDTLLESELFGYEEGAFTGARKGGHPGLFEVAQGGTLFLDEIGELPLQLQAKLLRVLEDRTIRRIGGKKSIPVDVRIITASNRNLPDMVAKGQFREDLFYRLHVIPIRIPPLRERKHDIPLLAQYFVTKVCQQINRPTAQLSASAIRYLQSHHWPGNVRELQNVLERAVYLTISHEINVEHVTIATHYSHQETVHVSQQNTLKHQVDQFERNVLIEALKQCTSARQAAQQLGISHTAVLNKMKKYGIEGTL